MNDLILDSMIYDLKTIQKAIKAYRPLCSISVHKSGNHTVCHFEQCKYGLEQTQKEFENHLIALINTRD